jgi:hypothetical protein
VTRVNLSDLSVVTRVNRSDLYPVPQARFYAIIPAIMAATLVFLDQNITVRLVNSPRHKLKKGYGFHLVSATTWRIACPPLR